MVKIEDIVYLVKNKRYEEALELVRQLKDNLEKVLALSSMAREAFYTDPTVTYSFLEDAEYFSEKIKDKREKAIALADIASVYFLAGDVDYSMSLFEDAIKETEKIKNPEIRIKPLEEIAYYMGISGLVELSFELFERIFDIIVNLKINYVKKTEYLLDLGDMMERVGDRLPSQEAITFYERAHDLFEKLHVPAKAATVEKKLDLAKTLTTVGLPEIRNAVREGKYVYATKLVIRKFDEEKMIIGLLEIALWMKKNETLGYNQIVDSALKYLNKITFSPNLLKYIVRLLINLERFEKALKLSVKIEDTYVRSEIMREISIGMLKSGEIEGALKLAEMIPDEDTRLSTLIELKKMIKY
ncbi:hypothetical protein K1720_08960 [Thermococcus argininiproducens]|uniref:Tetratricopeptide repeat protein n=1 Tax=Thermococcus argininiproducens TaxID=2866384 RepID=A0A9E7SEI8_9EURY|nr:hypothetical protein [Thermococcus argininiproducens]USH00973.1 hypothetical protein K1720_08960 [Thermococcus argininiproducens]